MEDIKRIINILKIVQSKIGEKRIKIEDFDELNIEKSRLDYYLQIIQHDGLIFGFTDNPLFSYDNIKITTRGLLFIKENS